MYYAFKPNPKQLVENKAHNLFGNDADVDVTGRRPTAQECKDLGIPTGTYYVTCSVNGVQVATANTKDWRKAYKLLVVEVEKAYENFLVVGTVAV